MRVPRRLVPFVVVLLGGCPSLCDEESSEPDLCTYFVDLYVDDLPVSGRVRVTAGAYDQTHAVSAGFLLLDLDCTTYTVELVEPTNVWFPTRTRTVTTANTGAEFEGYRPRSITGSVTWSGQGVAGITITATANRGPTDPRSRQAVTDAQGRYAMPGPLYGDITVTAPASIPGGNICRTGRSECDNARELSRFVSVAPVHFEVRPPNPTTIAGAVTVDGLPLAGVTVTLTGGPQPVVRTTDAMGSYTATQLPQGTYTVSISGFDATAAFFPATTQQVNANTNSEFRADFAGTRTRPNQAPTALIAAPAAGSMFAQGASITLTGTANDPEDGALSGASLAWSSDRDGGLGSGGTLTTTSLSVGTHLITLTATDSQGATGTATVTIEVIAAGAIQGRITLYGNDPLPGVTVQLSGNGVSLTTQSAGNGTYAFQGLQPGTYTVTVFAPANMAFQAATLTVTVSAGQTASADFDAHYTGELD